MDVNITLSNGEKNYIIDGCVDGLRADGRGHFDYRPIILESGVLANTDGSARIRMGATDVLVGIKADLAIVDNTEAEINRLKFFVDFSANATPKFEGRGGEEYAEEIANSLFEAYNNEEALPDMPKAPLVVCANKVGDVSVVDTTILEENCATSSIYIGVIPPECDYNPRAPSVSDDDCILTLVRKGKFGSLELDSIDEMINTGVRAARELNKALLMRIADEQVDPSTQPTHRSCSFLS